MNKIIYISTIIIGLALVSCSKQDISPVNNEPVVAPTWDFEKGAIFSVSDDPSDSEGDLDVEGSEDGTPGGITDPNNDPDGKTKGK